MVESDYDYDYDYDWDYDYDYDYDYDWEAGWLMATEAQAISHTPSNAATDDVIAWLLAGDPAIRWQTLRDLQAAPPDVWQAERRRTLESGWGARLLALQAADGGWGGGVYSPKWISTTYTMLALDALGVPPHAATARGAAQMVDRLLGPHDSARFAERLPTLDQCITGMLLQIGSRYLPDDARNDLLAQQLVTAMMGDGAWNCRRLSRPQPHHSSLHTTFNVLDGLRAWLAARPAHPLRAAVLAAERSALEFTLMHRLYKSDRTGEPINPHFTRLSYPHYWHYTTLRGLSYLAAIDAPRDARAQDALDVLRGKRRADGTWPVQYRIAGRVHFHMEPAGNASRWNTLRALRVLRWWDA